MTLLSIESSSWNNDFAIPYPTYFHPSKKSQVTINLIHLPLIIIFYHFLIITLIFKKCQFSILTFQIIFNFTIRLRFSVKSVFGIAILNQIAKNESVENYIFKKLRFENAENYFFKS
jgi:hypothetical protein